MTRGSTTSAAGTCTPRSGSSGRRDVRATGCCFGVCDKRILCCCERGYTPADQTGGFCNLRLGPERSVVLSPDGSAVVYTRCTHHETDSSWDSSHDGIPGYLQGCSIVLASIPNGSLMQQFEQGNVLAHVGSKMVVSLPLAVQPTTILRSVCGRHRPTQCGITRNLNSISIHRFNGFSDSARLIVLSKPVPLPGKTSRHDRDGECRHAADLPVK